MLKRTISAIAAAVLLTLAATAAISADHTDGPPDDLQSGDVYTVHKQIGDRSFEVFSWTFLESHGDPDTAFSWWIVEHDDRRPGIFHMQMRKRDILLMLEFFDAAPRLSITHSRPYEPPQR